MIYYVALPFTRSDETIVPGQPMECPHEAAAVRRASAMARNKDNVGAVAFSRRGEPSLGEYEDAVVLGKFGEVPEDFGGTAR